MVQSREEMLAVRRIARKRRADAAKAGLAPNRPGRPKEHLTEEERLAAIKRDKAKWRRENADLERETAARRGREKRALRAVAEGRPPGKSGNWTKFTKEEIRQKRKEYVRNNRALIRAHVRLRHARRKANKHGGGGKYKVSDIDYLFALQKGNCVFCLQPLVKGHFHIDHYVPLAKGGTNDRSNLRLLHKKCNLTKGARDPAEHALQNGLLCW
jgi:5-methylcytosine-specific restriction endonuclease McrA